MKTEDQVLLYTPEEEEPDQNNYLQQNGSIY